MRLAKWIKFIKTNINFYRDGFFELPYLSNSPQLMLKSIINSPAARHVASEQAVYRNNPFSKGVMRTEKSKTVFGSFLPVLPSGKTYYSRLFTTKKCRAITIR